MLSFLECFIFLQLTVTTLQSAHININTIIPEQSSTRRDVLLSLVTGFNVSYNPRLKENYGNLEEIGSEIQCFPAICLSSHRSTIFVGFSTFPRVHFLGRDSIGVRGLVLLLGKWTGARESRMWVSQRENRDMIRPKEGHDEPK